VSVIRVQLGFLEVHEDSIRTSRQHNYEVLTITVHKILLYAEYIDSIIQACNLYMQL